MTDQRRAGELAALVDHYERGGADHLDQSYHRTFEAIGALVAAA